MARLIGVNEFPDFEDPDVLKGPWKKRFDRGIPCGPGMSPVQFYRIDTPTFMRLQLIAKERVEGIEKLNLKSTHNMKQGERSKMVFHHNLLGVMGEAAGHHSLFGSIRGLLLQHDRYRGQCDGGQDVLNANINFKTSEYRPGGLRGYVSPQEFRRNMVYVFCWAKTFGPEGKEADRGWACTVGWAWGWEFPKTTETPKGWRSPVYILGLDKLHPVMPVIRPYKAIDDPETT